MQIICILFTFFLIHLFFSFFLFIRNQVGYIMYFYMYFLYIHTTYLLYEHVYIILEKQHIQDENVNFMFRDTVYSCIL